MNFWRRIPTVTNETKSQVEASIKRLCLMLHHVSVLPVLALIALLAFGCAAPAPGVQMNVFETPQPTTPQVATVVVGPASTSLPLTQIKTKTPAPGIAAGGIINMQNAESGVTLHVGERFLLNLGDRDWKVRIGDETIMRLGESTAVPQGSQGYFEALKAGTTKIYATSDPACRQATPPCMLPTLFLEIPVTVLP
jgi:hypothetical protein